MCMPVIAVPGTHALTCMCALQGKLNGWRRSCGARVRLRAPTALCRRFRRTCSKTATSACSRSSNLTAPLTMCVPSSPPPVAHPVTSHGTQRDTSRIRTARHALVACEVHTLVAREHHCFSSELIPLFWSVRSFPGEPRTAQAHSHSIDRTCWNKHPTQCGLHYITLHCTSDWLAFHQSTQSTLECYLDPLVIARCKNV
jgi:hypothetical protein